MAVFVLTRAAARVAQRAMAQVESNVDVSHVCKLTRAARKQYFAGHHARAVELFERVPPLLRRCASPTASSWHTFAIGA